MFKKGQLVRSRVSERVLEVLARPTIRVVNTGEVFRLNHSSVDLIANNYQPFDDPRAGAARKAKGE